MSFFKELLPTAGAGLITLPITKFIDASNTLSGAIGIAVPASAVSSLDKLGLFSHSTAEKIAKAILEPNGPTITARWMDAVGEYADLYPKGVQLGYHRALHGHHFITDFMRTLSDKNLSCIDFVKYLGTDVVTKNGLPLLPASTIEAISNTLGISVSKIAPWVSLNILDGISSIFAVGHAAGNIVDVICGSAKWSAEYGLRSFGGGALEMTFGFLTKNPILLSAGAADIACGAVTACDYYSQPFLCGVPVSEILQSGVIGAAISTLLTGVELIINRKRYTPSEAVQKLSKRIAASGFISSLAAISPPLAVTAAAGFTGYKLAKACAEHEATYLKAIPLTGAFSNRIDQMILSKYPHGHSLKDKLPFTGKYLEPGNE